METIDISALKQDEKRLNAYLGSMKTSVLKMAGHILNRHVDASDEAYAIALYALYEAIQKHDPSRGSFEHFAYRVIKSRLFDAGRKEKRLHQKEDLIGDVSDQRIQTFFSTQALSDYAILSSRDQMQLEILKLSDALSQFGISYDLLYKKRPKTQKTNAMITSLIQCMANEPRLYDSLLATGTLPIKSFESCQSFNRKSIERHRAYIIARLIIWFGEYPLIKKNINWRPL